MRKKWIFSGIVVLIFMLSILLTFTTQSPAAQVTLAWDANTESDLAGYKLHIGYGARSYTQTINVGNITSYTLNNLSSGTIYFISLTAFNIQGLQSDFSNEVVCIVTPTGYATDVSRAMAPIIAWYLKKRNQ